MNYFTKKYRESGYHDGLVMGQEITLNRLHELNAICYDENGKICFREIYPEDLEELEENEDI